MALCVRVKLKDAEAIRRRLVDEGLFDPGYRISRDASHAYIPVKKHPRDYEIAERVLEPAGQKPRSLREALGGKLTDAEAEALVTSFDIIGDIAVIEVPAKLRKKEKAIGEAILAVHRNVKTVCARAGAHRGTFRIRPVRVIAGEKRTTTEYMESGARMRLDLAKVYFSPRRSHERERVAGLVKPGETVAVFFSGVAPSPLVIFKRQPLARIYAIELNPAAHRYAVENIRLNRAQQAITPILGDVRKVAPSLGVKFDRITMPLPKGAEDFLDTAFKCAAPGCIVHFYQFSPEQDPFTAAVGRVQKAASRAGRRVEVLEKRIVRVYAPHVFQVVIDFRIL